MIIFLLSAGFVALCVAAVLLARASLPTDSVAQLLYDTEHPGQRQ